MSNVIDLSHCLSHFTFISTSTLLFRNATVDVDWPTSLIIRRFSLCFFTTSCLPCLPNASTERWSSSHRREGSRQSVIPNAGQHSRARKYSAQKLALLSTLLCLFQSVSQLLASECLLFHIPEIGFVPLSGVSKEP